MANGAIKDHCRNRNNGCKQDQEGDGNQHMAESRYFQKALSDFTYEAASGGAIRHLADSGYTVRQIADHLDYPTPYERIQKTVWEQLLAREIILKERPGSGGPTLKTTYVKEYDQYGKSSFRRVVEREEKAAVTNWTEQFVDRGQNAETLLNLLREKRDINGVNYAYASFEFGLWARRDPIEYEAMLSVLDAHQRDYVAGLPWDECRVYHKLDSRAMEILVQLYREGRYQGECCFLKTGELLKIK